MLLTKVLLADDDRVTVEVMSAALRAKRVRVVTAADAMQAVMFAIREVPDAIVLDIGMPGGTGMTALQKLRDNWRTAMIPILVLTGQTDPDLPAKVKDLGAAYARKPLRPADLHPLLEEMVAHRTQLVESVMSVVRGSAIDEIVSALAAQGRDATEAELWVVLRHLAARNEVVEKEGYWYIA